MLNDFPLKISATVVVALTLASGCAGGRSKADRDELASMRNQLSEMRGLFATLTTRVEAVEGKLTTLSANSTPVDRVSTSNANASPVEPHPAEGSGLTPMDAPSAHDPDGAFVNDDAVQDFRRAMIRFRANQFTESANAFSSFLEKYPDHALAGNAAYLLGRSYYKQGNYRQAIEEYQRVLTTYDRSPHVAATLRDLADAEDRMKQTDDAARHRQLLTSLFPHSPESQPMRDSAPISAPPSTKLDTPPTAPVPTAANPQETTSLPVTGERAVVPMQDSAPSNAPGATAPMNAGAPQAPSNVPLDSVPAATPPKE